ncbi:MAG: hypothetical protein HP491_02685 [Nitrospira sp.]|nr:hypothetical protein [Nitrospira sp.]MBH0184391.1 hypothetical protein [Nitrospira sp.]
MSKSSAFFSTLRLLILPLSVFGCASIEATHDHSRTIEVKKADRGPRTIAIAPVVEMAAVEGLPKNLGTALVLALEAKSRDAQIQGAEKLNASLLADDSVETFARWRSTYKQTGILDPRPLATLQKAIGARYLLLPLDTYVDREKISPQEAQCPSVCSVNPNNLWRTKLKVLAELIDTQNGVVVWRGVGEAQRIQNGGKTLDFGLVVIHPGKGEEVETLAGRMIVVVAQGIAKGVDSFFR